ncbi:hypothetical protein Hanom_Chr00s092290g01799541 [Helianthus anomalus]
MLPFLRGFIQSCLYSNQHQFWSIGFHNLAICFRIGCIVAVFMLAMMSLHDMVWMLNGLLKNNISWMKVFPFATYLDSGASAVIVEEADLIQSKLMYPVTTM